MGERKKNRPIRCEITSSPLSLLNGLSKSQSRRKGRKGEKDLASATYGISEHVDPRFNDTEGRTEFRSTYFEFTDFEATFVRLIVRKMR